MPQSGFYLNTLYSDIKDKSGQITALNTELRAANVQISELKGTVSSLSPLFEASKQDVTQLRGQVAGLQTENASKSAEIASLSSTKDQNLQQITRLNDDISYLYRRVNVYISGLAPAAQSGYRDKIARVNDILRVFRIEPWSISIDGWDIEVSYIILRKEEDVKEPQLQLRLFSFETMAYTLSEGLHCHAMADLCSDLCKAMDYAVSAYNETESGAHRAAYDKLKQADSHIGLKEEQIEIAEITRLLRLMEEVSDKSYLFLRGTADGTTHSWTRQLEEGYKFGEIERYLVDINQCEGDRIGCWHFSRSNAMAVPNPYTETQLPNLRAAYVNTNISSFMNSCSKAVPWSTKIKILDGIDDKRIAESIRVPVRAVAGVIVIGQQTH